MSYWQKPFSVSIVAHVFQPVSNQVEIVEIASVAAAVVFVGSKKRMRQQQEHAP